jgi:hypothetical protein
VIKDGKIFVKRCSVLWLTLAAMCLTPGFSYAAKMALLLQQSPADGGSIEPGTGVHQLECNSQITLRAVPQQGYQFVTWLGDVDEPTSPVTEAYMDSPKIVIAVFERSQYESIEAADILFSRPGGGLRGSAADIGSGGGGGGVTGRQWHSEPLRRILRPEEEPDELPVPDEAENDDFPVPEVPEPATLTLFALAGILIRMQSRKRRL